LLLQETLQDIISFAGAEQNELLMRKCVKPVVFELWIT
jgi:hypothetical protein